jgi:hypothetical protein
VGLAASGSVLIMAFIGGVGHYFGPVIGAGLVSFLQSALSTYTKAWLLYFGLFFMVMIMFAPGGIASLITVHGPALRHRLLARLIPGYLMAGAALALLLAGFVALVEMTYNLKSADASGTSFELFGLALEVGTARPWVLRAGLPAARLLLAALRPCGAYGRGECRRAGQRGQHERAAPALELRAVHSEPAHGHHQRRRSDVGVSVASSARTVRQVHAVQSRQRPLSAQLRADPPAWGGRERLGAAADQPARAVAQLSDH